MWPSGEGMSLEVGFGILNTTPFPVSLSLPSDCVSGCEPSATAPVPFLHDSHGLQPPGLKVPNQCLCLQVASIVVYVLSQVQSNKDNYFVSGKKLGANQKK